MLKAVVFGAACWPPGSVAALPPATAVRCSFHWEVRGDRDDTALLLSPFDVPASSPAAAAAAAAAAGDGGGDAEDVEGGDGLVKGTTKLQSAAAT